MMTRCFRSLIAAVCAVSSIASWGVAAAAGLTKIADNVYAYVDTRGSGPANSFGANAGVIVGSDGIMVVDTASFQKYLKK